VNKEYEIVDEQIGQLKEKGLNFKDEQMARKIILRENYYYLTEGYEKIFLDLKHSTKEKEVYEEETYFEELYAIYKLDRELKNLIFDYINIVETNMKSFTAYVFAKQYGEKDFLKRENFIEDGYCDRKYEQLKMQIDTNLHRNYKNPKSDIKKYKDANNFISIFVLVKVLTFGNMVNFYELMKPEDKQRVAQHFNVSPVSLGKYIRMLNIVRNICAHADILFNLSINMELKGKECDIHKKLQVPKDARGYRFGTNDLFAVMIILKKLLSKQDFNKMFIKIETMLSDVKSELDEQSYQNLMRIMGFPELYGLLNNL